MKNTLQSIFFFLLWLTMSNTSAANDIDISAISKLINLQQSSKPLSISELEENYLASDAGGLRMLRGRFQNAEHLYNYYAALQSNDWQLYGQCAELLSSLEPNFKSLKKRLSGITGVPLQDVTAYGVIGIGNTAATASPTGIVLGLEMICAENELTATTQLTLENYLAHELVHVVQYRLTKRADLNFNLLELAVLEGTADYVAELLLGAGYILDNARSEYGENQIDELIASFETTMLTQNFAPWLYTKTKAMPMDMGYWIGYKVAEAYLRNGGSIVDLLTLDDAEAIFAKADL